MKISIDGREYTVVNDKIYTIIKIIVGLVPWVGTSLVLGFEDKCIPSRKAKARSIADHMLQLLEEKLTATKGLAELECDNTAFFLFWMSTLTVMLSMSMSMSANRAMLLEVVDAVAKSLKKSPDELINTEIQQLVELMKMLMDAFCENDGGMARYDELAQRLFRNQ